MSKTRRNLARSNNNGTNGHGNNRLEDLFNGHAQANSKIYTQSKPAAPTKELKSIIHAKNPNQKNYIRTVKESDITFCMGPAGVGKTAIAVGIAAYYLSKGHIDKIIVTRPVVSCEDEDLGFLPGDMEAKVSPYLRPIFDEFQQFFTEEQMKFFRDGEFPIIEIAPLAFIKGRTFKKCMMILDEAQDATYKQIKKFLTRMGDGSKIIITGDITQSDLPAHKNDHGMEQFVRELEGLEGVGFAELQKCDIVRHPLIAKILERTEQYHKG